MPVPATIRASARDQKRRVRVGLGERSKAETCRRGRPSGKSMTLEADCIPIPTCGLTPGSSSPTSRQRRRRMIMHDYTRFFGGPLSARRRPRPRGRLSPRRHQEVWMHHFKKGGHEVWRDTIECLENLLSKAVRCKSVNVSDRGK